MILKLIKYLSFLFLLVSTTQAFELVFVEAVSSSAKTFVIRRGAKEGIAVGQKATFSSENYSFNAIVETVNHQFSHWKIIEEDATIPFSRGQIITYNQSVEALWSDLAMIERKKTVAEKINEYATERSLTELQKNKLSKDGNYGQNKLEFYTHSLTLAAGIAYSLNESTSNTDDELQSRSGNHFTGLYHRHVYGDLYFGGGLRYDMETISLDETLDIKTSRTMGVVDARYDFKLFKKNDSNFYFGVSFGVGRSATTILGDTATGIAYMIPSVRLGMETPFASGWSIIFEGAFESFRVSESYADGFKQSTDFTDAKGNIGLVRYF